MSREFPKNPEPQIALPTVGRIIHVFIPEYAKAMPAMVVEVDGHSLTITTAHAFLPDGLRVLNSLVHVSEPRHPNNAYWDWMDYQKGQAAKTEALEALLGKTK